ncbi:MAG: M14 family metallopeptidase [Aliiglaciecola sp.]|uniref:M14 family metallopeptidase n=1 Tax=Aliiglaciecola sp. TaxID=1872441 RepID=UPI003298C49F
MNLKRFCATVLFLSLSFSASALSDLDYLPKTVSYDPSIPKPEDVLGSPVGTWHARHDQIVRYMEILAESSDRVSLTETGKTYENRRLLLMTITAADNQKNIKSIQKRHLEVIEQGAKSNDKDPLILWMGYSVHGDESSGANASLLVAYYLAAAQGPEVDKLLANNIVLLDPALNPDGLARFAHWANMHRSQNLVSDPNNRELSQRWPRGRVNHYWFDLNRDWLLLTHPSSRARIKQFQQWRPHVLTDFHEMGPNRTFFFQPGISSRKNPWTPDQNVKLTEALGNFHAAALDDTKQLYFTQESYDDFYYGKGSTYPDGLGTIGILFEQASSRGHLQDTVNGPLAFSDTIQNQVTTSLSTFKGALANKQALVEYQSNFNKLTDELIKDDRVKGYLISESRDKARFNQLKKILQQHKIEHYSLNKNAKIDDVTYNSVDSIFVPTDQPRYRLVKSIFSTRKRFDDNTFYDVSNWNLALAFNLQYTEVDKGDFRKVSYSDKQAELKVDKLPMLQGNAYAYGFSWEDYKAPKFLQRLLQSGIQVRAAESAFSAKTSSGTISFSSGSIVIPTGLNQPDDMLATIQSLSNQLNIPVWSIESGLTGQGIDLGSAKMSPITLPKVMIVGGLGVNQYEAGETWHYLDTRVGMPVSIIDMDRLSALDMSSYTHMIWVSGNYKNLPESVIEKVAEWVDEGGVLIGQQSGTKFLSDNGWLKAAFMKRSEIQDAFSAKNLQFGDREAFAAKQRIAGAVFETKLDISHPLGFGYTRSLLPVFRNTTEVLLMPEQPFITAAKYVEKPLMAGFASDEMQDLISDSAAVVAHRFGKGRVIGFVNNPNFRGVWYGTSRLMGNAIFMSKFID